MESAAVLPPKEAKMPRITTDLNFESDVLNSPIPVLVNFWAPWCAPCRVVDPIIDTISQKAGTQATVFRMNVDENSLIPSRYGITAVPTIVVFTKGRITREIVGVEREEVYAGAIPLW
jgi:thioredoxin 1